MQERNPQNVLLDQLTIEGKGLHSDMPHFAREMEAAFVHLA